MPPVDKTPDIETGSFHLINGLQAFNKIPIYEYKSLNTGLTVVIAEVDGPIVNGYFCLATEAFDDDGLPHTLEHLIFLGSEQYPYKGVLDLLANRCLASGTNAWTDTDHTCYTMETAGTEGFLALMPIFLEHILYPCLTEAGFVTEVHHITPEGSDAGVVYCEMQGRENSAESRLHVNMARAMYPGKCGYSSETGGIMKNLRESTTNAKVINYHREFYRPENLKVIITGQIKHTDVFKALEELERKILQKKDERGPFEKPWQSPVPPLTESKDLHIKYPTDEENNGLFCLGWRGPSAVKEFYELTALSILMKYLTEFPTYDLSQEFVEIDDPFASNVAYNLIENSESCVYIVFEDVPLEKISKIKPKLMESLKNKMESEAIKMDRIQNILKRKKLEYLSNVENSPHNTLAFIIIGQVLYGESKDDFTQRANPQQDLDRLLLEPKSFWVNLLKKYLVDAHYVAIECVPSKAEQVRMAEEEAKRIEKQIEQLGPDGLKEKAKQLEEALTFNGRDPPSEMLTSIPIPSLDTISFYEISRYRSDSEYRKQIDLSKANVFTCFDDLKSEFVYMHALLDTSELPNELRIYLPLIMEALFESPIKQSNGEELSYEQVVEKLQNDTVSFGSNIGLGAKGRLFKCGAFSTTISVTLQVEIAKYEIGVEWLRNLLYNVEFSSDRLKIIATKMSNAISQAKRSGRNIVSYAMDGLRFNEKSNVHNSGILLQHEFLSEAIEKLGNEKTAAEIISKCKEVWAFVTNPKYVVLHMVGNVDQICNADEQLAKFLPGEVEPIQRALNSTPNSKLIKSSKEQPIEGCIINMGCLESSFFIQTVESISSHDDPDLPALLLYLQYLIQAEGPMWRQIRGKGYSYGYTMTIQPDEGLLYMIFSRATNVVGAYEEAKEILENQLRSKEWDANLIDSAKSSLIFELIEKERNIGSVIYLSVVSYFQNVDFTYNRQLLTLIPKVSVDDLNRVGERFLKDLFNVDKTKTVIVSDPAKGEQIKESFKSMGWNLTVYPSLEESFLKVAK